MSGRLTRAPRDAQFPVKGYTDCASLLRALLRCVRQGADLQPAPPSINLSLADPFLGQTATPEVAAVDPYAVKGKN